MNINIRTKNRTGKQTCLVSLATFLLAGLCFGQASGSPADWTQFHRTNMERFNSYENVLNVNNVGGLGLNWSYTSGRVVDSSPAVVNGVVYVGSWDHNVYALNASTGARLWSYATGNLVDSAPAVTNGVVYTGSRDHNLYALKASNGHKLWSYGPTQGADESSPAVANGVLYVGSDDLHMYALDASSGAELWSYSTGDAVRSSPVVVDGVVYVGDEGGKIYAFGLQ